MECLRGVLVFREHVQGNWIFAKLSAYKEENTAMSSVVS